MFADKMDALQKVYVITKEREAQRFKFSPLTRVVTFPLVAPIMLVIIGTSRSLLDLAILLWWMLS